MPTKRVVPRPKSQGHKHFGLLSGRHAENREASCVVSAIERRSLRRTPRSAIRVHCTPRRGIRRNIEVRHIMAHWATKWRARRGGVKSLGYLCLVLFRFRRGSGPFFRVDLPNRWNRTGNRRYRAINGHRICSSCPRASCATLGIPGRFGIPPGTELEHKTGVNGRKFSPIHARRQKRRARHSFWRYLDFRYLNSRKGGNPVFLGDS